MDKPLWTYRPMPPGQPLTGTGLFITREDTPRLNLLSGPLDSALERLCPGAQMLGLGDVPRKPNFAMRIARDHAVLATKSPLNRAAGWQPECCALSPADDRYAAISLRGERAEDVLCRGLHHGLPRGSASCAVRFARKTVLITGLRDGFTLWVDQAELTYFSTFFAGVIHD